MYIFIRAKNLRWPHLSSASFHPWLCPCTVCVCVYCVCMCVCRVWYVCVYSLYKFVIFNWRVIVIYYIPTEVWHKISTKLLQYQCSQDGFLLRVAVQANIPKFVAYFACFFVISTYWGCHVRLYNLVVHSNDILTWMNLVMRFHSNSNHLARMRFIL